MSNCRTFIAVVITLVFAAGAQAADVHGVLQVVKGDVQIKSAKDGKVSKAKVGSKIFPKDTITTGKDSRAKIVMVDNNVLNISPETNLEIQNYEYAPEQGKKDVLLNVLYGKVRSKVEQKYDGKSTKFQLKTPTAVAGVRGTDFIGGYTPPMPSGPNMPAAPGAGTSTFVTFEGRVAVGQIGANNTIINPVFVNPGQTTNVAANQQPEPPKEMPKQQLANMDRESKAETATGQTSPAPNDPRAPAAEEKKEEKKEDPKKNDGAAKGANATGAVKGAVGTAAGAAGTAAGATGEAAGSATGTGTGTAANSPGGAAPNPALGREPASAAPPGGSMLRPEDFAGAPTSNVMPTLTNVMPPPVGLPNPQFLNPTELCPTCREVIQNGNNIVIIKVTHPNP